MARATQAALVVIVSAVLGVAVAMGASAAPNAESVTITGGPSGSTSSTDATFTFTGSTGVTAFKCKLEGVSSDCTSPKSYGGLSVGSHTFVVQGFRGTLDLNVFDSRTWTVIPPPDTSPPQTTITKAPPEFVTGLQVTLEFIASEPATFTCIVDGLAPAACNSPTTLSGLADGKHTFSVAATDAANNGDPTPAMATWTNDTQAPAASMVLPKHASAALDDDFTVSWQAADIGSGIAHYDVRYRKARYDTKFLLTAKAGKWFPFKFDAPIVGQLFDGRTGWTYCFSARAQDNAGNQGPWSAEACTVVPLAASQLKHFFGWKWHPGSGYYLGGFQRPTALDPARPISTPEGVRPRTVIVLYTRCPDCGSVRIWLGSTRFCQLSPSSPPAITLNMAGAPLIKRLGKHLQFSKPLPTEQQYFGKTLSICVLRLGGSPRIEGIGVSRVGGL